MFINRTIADVWYGDQEVEGVQVEFSNLSADEKDKNPDAHNQLSITFEFEGKKVTIYLSHQDLKEAMQYADEF